MYDNWEQLEESIVNCKKCGLCSNRLNIVFGAGNKQADIMFIGEGPGADEDKQGIPFVGKAGQLMNMAFEGLGINREEVYIGSVALKNILGEEYGITLSRGKWIEQKGIYYLPTWHPAELLRNENKKIEFWNDLKMVKEKIKEI